jgi:hypothetical protein
MALIDISLAAHDGDLLQRIAACIAQQTPGSQEAPESIAGLHMWRICAEPGWSDAYASALAAGVADPGLDAGVIPDTWILAAVQKHLSKASG